jgi:CheY-like chemotaxis protein
MKRRILIVDDDAEVLWLFSKFLERRDREIETASSGKQALERVRAGPFDLILLDLKMPDMDGTETLREIRKIDPEVPVYIVTAFQAEWEDRLRRMSEDGIAFELLRKPIERRELLLAVESVLEGPQIV